MRFKSRYNMRNLIFIISPISIILFLSLSSPVLGHGGKTHGETDFTALNAVQKGMELYDRLIAAGKLPESWETELAGIEVNLREKEGGAEYAVSFHREQGEPAAVYFFFTMKGEYAGSNFTGK